MTILNLAFLALFFVAVHNACPQERQVGLTRFYNYQLEETNDGGFLVGELNNSMCETIHTIIHP